MKQLSKKETLIFVIGLSLLVCYLIIALNSFNLLEDKESTQPLSFESTSNLSLQERHTTSENQKQEFKNNELVTINNEPPEQYSGTVPDLSDIEYNELDKKVLVKTRNEILNGWHTYTWSNGDMYSGHWIEGRMDGEGIYTWIDGVYVDTQFKKGFPVKDTFEFKGKIYRIFR